MAPGSLRGIYGRCLQECSHPLMLRLFRNHIAFVPVIFAIFVNIIVWVVVLVILAPHPRLLGSTVLAYTYGLRHALDGT